MPAPANLVHEISTSTGTGNFTLSAQNGKQRFSTAFGTGVTLNVFDYYISNQDAAEWERGTGHMSATSTLVRDTVIESTNANAAVNFTAGTKNVTNDVPAAKQVTTEGGKILTGSLTLPNTGLHIRDTGGDNDYIIVPGENATADRTLTLSLQDANRSLTFGGNLTLSANVTLNQSLQTTDSPQFVNESMTGFLDIAEIAEPANPAANVARLRTIDDGAGITTFGMRDAAGNVVPMSHFKASGTGAVTRTQQAKLRDGVSVKDFGALGDTIIGVSGTNDTTAFTAALAAMSSLNASLYIPAGTYTLNSATLAKTLSAGQSLKIYGDGPDATILYFPNNGTGITFNYTSNSFAWIGGNNLLLQDMTFVTNVQNTGSGVVINGASLIGDPNRPTIANRVGFRGTLLNSSYWTVGFNINDLQNFTWNDGYFFSFTLGLLGTALTYNGSTNAAHPTVCNVQGLQMQFGDVGINCGGFIEGLNVDQCNFTQVNRGVHWDSNGALPQCSVTNSQINAAISCIDLIDATASQISGNLFFATGAGQTAIAGNPQFSTITGNTFIGQNGTPPNGIIMQSGATNNLIADNVFNGFVTNIILQSGANNNIVGMNRHASGTPLSDSGTGNLALIPTSGAIGSNVPLKIPVFAVASLPSAATVGAGAIAVVNNASAPALGAAVVGGGAVTCIVHSNGAGWIVA